MISYRFRETATETHEMPETIHGNETLSQMYLNGLKNHGGM
jgi:hypothetical protein